MRLADPISLILREKGHDIWYVTPDSSVYDAIAMMSNKGVGALLVIEGGRLVGIISERDYARKVILKGRASKETLVREIMTRPVISATPGHTVDDCMAVMTNNRIRHLPIMEGDRVLGVVSVGDLVKWIISAQHEAIHQLENYITGKYPA